MIKLGCCTEEQSFTESNEGELLFEMWKYLSSEQTVLKNVEDEDIPTDRLKLFTMIILRVAEARVLQDYLANIHHGFKFEEAPLLLRKFDVFYLNRL